ncbi:MAG: OmpA family protein [Candidatus Cloacimonadaceae bacterium]
MYDRSKGSLGFNIWTVFADLAFGFMIIILLLFMMNVAKLREFASYAKAAMEDRKEIMKALEEANLLLSGDSEGDKGKTLLTHEIEWPTDKFEINDLSGEAQVLIIKFGEILKEFLDKPDTKKSEEYRYQTYTIIIIGHANLEGRDRDYNNYKLSHQRAHSVREYLFEKVFGGESGKDDYKILATGYGDNHLITRKSKVLGDKCIEIAFKYDEMDMIKSDN